MTIAEPSKDGTESNENAAELNKNAAEPITDTLDANSCSLVDTSINTGRDMTRAESSKDRTVERECCRFEQECGRVDQGHCRCE